MGGGNNNSSIETPGDGSSTNPSVTHNISNHQGLTVQYKAVPVNIDNISEVSYDWDFGDGKYAENTGAEITHTYEKGGTYNVTVKLKKGGVQLAEYSNPYTINEEQGLVNNVLLAEPDVSDKLTYYFYATTASTDNVNYTWDFGDNSETESTGSDNTNTYTFPKYGKTYPVTVTSDTGYNTLDSTVLINIPGVTVDMECSTSGLSVVCTPILPPEIPDMTVEWDCGNGKPPVTTVGNEVVVCEYDDTDTDVTIKVEGSDDKLEEPVKDEEHFTVSKLFGMQVTGKQAIKEDKLTWQITVNGDLKATEGTLPAGYKVQYRFDYGDGNGFGQWKDADGNYDITDTYTFSRYPANGKTGYDVKVEAQVVKGEGLEPEKSSTNTKFDIAAPTASLTTESVTNVDGFGQKFCVKWDDASYLPAGSLKYTWNFGDGNGTTGNDTTGQCQTHVYKNTGKYDITIDIVSNDGKFDDGYVKQVKGSVTFNQSFNGLDSAINITPDENNPLKYTISSNVTSSSTDGSGNVGSDALEYTWEIGTGTGTETKTGKSIEHTFPKYGKNYSVKLTVTLKGTEISVTKSSQVAISKPALKIQTTQSIINLDQQSTWTSSITYNNKDIVLNNGFNPTYVWSVADEAISNNGASTLNHTFKSIGNKTVTLKVTSPQFDETLTATGNVEVIDPVEFKEIQITCNNDKWDAVKYTCSGKLIDQKGKEITDPSFSIDWKVADVNLAISSKSSAKVELILDWPTNRRANETPSRDFTANVVVKQNGNEVGSKDQQLTVKRAITYTANIAGFDESGANRTAKINFSNIQGPDGDGIIYHWTYNFKNRWGAKDSNTFSTNKDIQSYDFQNVQNQIYYIGSINGDPFADGNGIGLEIKGLSKPLKIYGVANQNAMFGPNFSFNGSGVVGLQPQYPGNDNMKGVTGRSGWYAYAFEHGFKLNKQMASPNINKPLIKGEIRKTNEIQHFNTTNGKFVSSISVNKDGMGVSSQYLGFQTSLFRKLISADFVVEAYHTSSDALKGGTNSEYIKFGTTIYLYGDDMFDIWMDQWAFP